MRRTFEELDHRDTPIGTIILRRRYDPRLGVEAYEVKLDDDFLMTSLVTDSEIALARLGLAETVGAPLDVVVGGLGLGYTAQAVLEHESVGTLLVIEALEPVIAWHQRGIVPLGPVLTGDARCRFVLGDFFALALSEAGLDPTAPGRRFDAILVDIDHSPDLLLDPGHAPFYRSEGLARVAGHLKPGGVFGLWSDELPDDAFTARLRDAFGEARAERVTFENPLNGEPFTQTVYLARRDGNSS
jgi:spermidine synthase